MAVVTACRTDDHAPARTVELPAPRLFDDAETLNHVQDLSVGENHDVWTVSSTAPFIHHFDSSGRLLASFGRAGAGPGELRVAYDIVAPTATDMAVRIWDPAAQRIVGFNRDGMLAGTSEAIERSPLGVPLVAEQMSYARLMPFERWKRGYLLQDIPPREVRGFEGTSAIATANLLVLDSAGTIVDTLAAFSGFQGSRRPPAGILDLAPIPICTVCPGGNAVVVDPYGQRVLTFNAADGSQHTDSLPLEGRAITDADITAWARHAASLEPLPGGAKLSSAQLDDIVNAFLTRRRGEVSAVGPPAVRVACDDAGHVWLQLYEAADNVRGLGRDWVRLGADDRPRRYRFPTRFQPFAIRNGLAYGVQADSLDVERIATVRIPEQR